MSSYSFAHSYSGLDFAEQPSYDFAILATQSSVYKAQWLNAFKSSYDYARSSTGLSMNSQDAYIFALKAAGQS